MRIQIVSSFVFGLCALAASAGTLTWVGGTDTKWSTPENWNTKACPANGDAVVISGTTENDLGSAEAPLQLAGLTAAGATTLTGNPLRFPTAGSKVAYSGGKFTCGVKLEVTATSGWFSLEGASGATIVLNGDLVSASGVFLTFYGANTVNGALTASGKSVYVYLNGGTCAYNGPVTCTTFAMNQNWSTPATGTHTFNNANNHITYLDDWRCIVRTGVKDALKGTYIRLGYTFFKGNSNFELMGFDQEIDRFMCPPVANSWSIKTDTRSGDTAGGHIIAQGTERLTLKATANCHFVGMVVGNPKIVWAPQGNYTFVVSNRTQACTQPIVVSNGTFAVEGGVEGTPVTFPNLTGFEVAVGAKVRIGTLQQNAFPKLATVNVETGGRFEITATANAPFIAGQVVATLADGAQIAMAAGQVWVMKSATVNGAGVKAGWYTGVAGNARAEQVDWIDGAGEIFVTDMPGLTITEAIWDAGAGSENPGAGTAANWVGDVVPDLSNGVTVAAFGGDGSRAVLDRPTTLNGLRVDRTQYGFELASDAGATLRLFKGGITSTNTTLRGGMEFRIAAPLELVAEQVWNSYFTLNVTGPLSAAADGIGLTLGGPGSVCLSGANTFQGKVAFTNGYLYLSGDSPLGTSAQQLAIMNNLVNNKANLGMKPSLTLNNATVRRPVWINNGDYTGPYPLNCVDGTTNTITGMLTASGLCRLGIGKGTLVLRGGWQPNHLLDPACDYDNGWIVVRDVPFTDIWYYVDGTGNLALEVPGNKFGSNAFLQPQHDGNRCRIETRVANAFTADCPLNIGAKVGKTTNCSTWNLCGFDQQCGSFTGNGVRTTVFTESPATLTVNQSANNTNSIAFKGPLSLVKAGDKELCLKGVSTATGAVSVVKGTLRFQTGSAWSSGTGFASDFSVTNGAKLALAEGVSIRARDLYLPAANGVLEKQPRGTWGSSASAARYKSDDFFSGAGVLRVEGNGVGCTIIIR